MTGISTVTVAIFALPVLLGFVPALAYWWGRADERDQIIDFARDEADTLFGNGHSAKAVVLDMLALDLASGKHKHR